MYALRNLLDKNPIQISGAVVALVNAIAAASSWAPSPETILAGETALVAVLGLFVAAKTENSASLNELADQ